MVELKSRRETFGFSLPPEGTTVQIKFMAGVNFYIHWPDCPDGEDILYGWLSKKNAYNIASKHKWILKTKSLILNPKF